jgi:hypothetical protein
MKLTQENLVLNFLAIGGRFTSHKARQLGIANPSAVVNNLRNKGHVIYSNRRKASRTRSFWALSYGQNHTANAARQMFQTVVTTPSWL